MHVTYYADNHVFCLCQVTVLDLASGIASGMSHLHKSNVIHGDLNPANVLLQRVNGSPRFVERMFRVFVCKLQTPKADT